jgi:hypothetical protein
MFFVDSLEPHPNLAATSNGPEPFVGNLYLIRHGQASFGADDYDVLSPVGVRQSLALVNTWPSWAAAGPLRGWRPAPPTGYRPPGAAGLHANGCPVPAVETDAAFNEFDADGVIRALLPDLLPDEPDALHVLRNVRSTAASSSACSP